MDLVRSVHIPDVGTAIYNNYMNNKVCFICLKDAAEFVDNDAVDETNMSVVDKLKFISKESENKVSIRFVHQ